MSPAQPHRGINRDGAAHCTDTECWCSAKCFDPHCWCNKSDSCVATGPVGGAFHIDWSKVIVPTVVAADTNPKTLMGRRKVPMLSVVPPAALAYLGVAMRFGAYESPRADGSKGYGPYNWRDQPVEASIYIDAAMRHLCEYFDGNDCDADPEDGGSGLPHLAHALATIAILIDAIENGTVLDDRPKVRKGAVTEIIKRYTRKV